eukprot:2513590-Pleurochrysis_carterae.AAC.3
MCIRDSNTGAPPTVMRLARLEKPEPTIAHHVRREGADVDVQARAATTLRKHAREYVRHTRAREMPKALVVY